MFCVADDNGRESLIVAFRIDDTELKTSLDHLLQEGGDDRRLPSARRSGDEDGVHRFQPMQPSVSIVADDRLELAQAGIAAGKVGAGQYFGELGHARAV